MQDIHDIEPPIPIGMDPVFIQILMGLAVVLVLAGLGMLLFFYLKRRKQKKMSANTLFLPPPLPPDQAAIKALDALAHALERDPRHYYFGISAILKIFMGKMFDMGAPEMTTQEVVASLSGLGLERNLTARTREFFHFAAMVKYAGITPEAPRIHKDHDLVREFIHSTAGMMENRDSGDVDLVNGIKTGNGMATENTMDRKNSNVHSPDSEDQPSYIKKVQ
jgi:hypothetical protein